MLDHRLPIQDYAVIGNCRSAALVSKAGSIDWLCWPRFDSPSIFGALLDPRAGRWTIAPRGPARAERRYVGDSNVLETRLTNSAGSLTITDLMPVASEADKARFLFPEHEIVRAIECTRGTVDVEMVYEPRPGYGRRAARVRDGGPLGIRAEVDEGLLILRTDLPAAPGDDGGVRAVERLHAGDRRHCSLSLARGEPAVLPPLGEWTRRGIARSVDWWQRWVSGMRYGGPAADAVRRSALVLRLLVYAPSGAVIAAPTTSLPERIGGPLNWDYRYCWLHDASLTVRAMLGLGYVPEAQAFVNWLLQSTRLTQPRLSILYDVHGNAPRPERTLAHLAGYRGSRPVRVGNAASRQVQMDVYGEVIDAVAHFIAAGGGLDSDTRRMLEMFGRYVLAHWDEPDEGIWEPRSGKRNHTHSRLLCWTALDRLLELHENAHLGGIPVRRFAAARDAIRREIETRAWNARLESYVARLDGDELDASLLLMPWYGFADAASPRMRKTYARIRDGLGAGNGLLYRYRTGDPPEEGAFGICCFWGVEFLALGGGTVEESEAVFRRLLGYGNDVGLFAEEIDPRSGAALGNFPQAFTHVGLINAALTIERRLTGRPAGREAQRRATGVEETRV
jgi:GH15 family glucan-1,4-alpha-glucosidase